MRKVFAVVVVVPFPDRKCSIQCIKLIKLKNVKTAFPGCAKIVPAISMRNNKRVKLLKHKWENWVGVV